MKPRYQVFLLFILIVSLLLAFDYLVLENNNLNLKPLYVFSSFRKDTIPVLPQREVFTAVPQKSPKSNTTHKGTTIANTPKSIVLLDKDSGNTIPLLEDFSIDHTNLQKLCYDFKNIATDTSSFRIAYFGDSFIEGDILTSDFRDTLQSVFGGEGVGLVPLTSPIAGFRKTVWSASQGFGTARVQDQKLKFSIGIEGQSFRVDSHNAKVQYVLHKPIQNAAVKIFYASLNPIYFRYSVGSAKEVKDSLFPGAGLHFWSSKFYNLSRIRFTFPKSSGFILHGISLDGQKGIQVDNFSIRGNSGYGLLSLNEALLSQFTSVLPYKLVIIHFGLNVTSPASHNYSFYIQPMKKVIDKIKRTFPNAIILIASVNDRSQKLNGTMQTLPSIPYLVNAQRRLAFETNSLFWNVYESMGGYNSMVKWAESKPSMANKDYTHINFLGGKKLGRLLAKLLLNSNKENEKNTTVIPADTLHPGP